MASVSTTKTRTFKCKCGNFQIQLTGDPFLDSNCHCHSCVASCRFVEEKHPGGTTAIQDHGATFTMFKSSQVKFQPDDLTDVFGAVKVGPDGKLIRLYTKCCGTMIGFIHPKFVGLNRNAIYNEDGSSFQSASPIHNIQKKNSFDPSLVPDPSYDTIPFKLMLKMLPVLLNPLGGPKLKDKAFYPNLADAEIVEITWE